MQQNQAEAQKLLIAELKAETALISRRSVAQAWNTDSIHKRSIP